MTNPNEPGDQGTDDATDKGETFDNSKEVEQGEWKEKPSKLIKSMTLTWVEMVLIVILSVAAGFLMVTVGSKSESEAPASLIQNGTQSNPDEGLIQASIEEIDPTMTLKRIMPTSFYGLYEAEADQGRVLYVNHDGSAIIHGALFEKENGFFVNKTERAYNAFVRETIDTIDEADFIEYKADEEQTTIVVFTDPGCPYCQKLHEDVPALNEAGITVKYLPFGRGGPGSESFAVLDSAWCADDRLEALTKVKKGEKMPSGDCDPIIEKYFDMGVDLGVQGTPYIFLEDGAVIRGYMPAEALIQALEHK